MFQKERITRKVFRYDINAETWKTNSRFQLNPAFGISHFEFWISHTFPIYFLLDIFRIGKSYHSQGAGWVAVFTWSLMKIEFNHRNFRMELVGVTLVTLLLKLTLNFQLSRGNSSVSWPRSLFKLCFHFYHHHYCIIIGIRSRCC